MSLFTRPIDWFTRGLWRPGGSAKHLWFQKLNEGWNAEPNAPDSRVRVSDDDVLLEFAVNPFLFELFEADEIGILRFSRCSRYRLGPTNDEGWYRGQCRYGRLAPGWGEFYEIVGEDPLRDEPTDWIPLGDETPHSRHFIFYLRDNTFEAIAHEWSFDTDGRNALLKLIR